MRRCCFVFFLWVLGSLACFAEKHEGYEIVARGGFFQLKDQNIVQGSMAFGGLQPDYLIDLEDPRLEPLYRFTEKWKAKKNVSAFEKIRALQDFLGFEFLPKWDPEGHEYRRLLKQYRNQGKTIPIGAYTEAGVGVCREFSMLTHIGLTALGLENRLVYGLIEEERAPGDFYYGNHGFAVIRYQGEDWIIDTYFPAYNGYRLSDALKKTGIPADAPRLPLRNREVRNFRRVTKIHKYPIIWAPKNRSKRSLQCERSLQ